MVVTGRRIVEINCISEKYFRFNASPKHEFHGPKGLLMNSHKSYRKGESAMHCDDKRMLYVLKEDIAKKWNMLRDADFSDEQLIKDLNESIRDYFEFRKSS